MQKLTSQIMGHAERLPEGSALSAKGFLHLGNRAALDQALSRLAEGGELVRAGRGIYMRPFKSRFESRPPAVEQWRNNAARSSSQTAPPRRMPWA